MNMMQGYICKIESRSMVTVRTDSEEKTVVLDRIGITPQKHRRLDEVCVVKVHMYSEAV